MASRARGGGSLATAGGLATTAGDGVLTGRSAGGDGLYPLATGRSGTAAGRAEDMDLRTSRSSRPMSFWLVLVRKLAWLDLKSVCDVVLDPILQQ